MQLGVAVSIVLKRKQIKHTKKFQVGSTALHLQQDSQNIRVKKAEIRRSTTVFARLIKKKQFIKILQIRNYIK